MVQRPVLATAIATLVLVPRVAAAVSEFSSGVLTFHPAGPDVPRTLRFYCDENFPSGMAVLAPGPGVIHAETGVAETGATGVAVSFDDGSSGEFAIALLPDEHGTDLVYVSAIASWLLLDRMRASDWIEIEVAGTAALRIPLDAASEDIDSFVRYCDTTALPRATEGFYRDLLDIPPAAREATAALSPKCDGGDVACWFEVDGRPGCHVWSAGGRAEVADWWVFRVSDKARCPSGALTGDVAVVGVEGNQAEGRLLNGKSDGHWVFHGSDGGRQAGPYAEGLRHGAWTIVRADGTAMEGPYVRGTMTGVWTHRHVDGGYQRGRLVDDVRQGPWVVHDADGTKSAGSYVDGERSGQWSVRKASGDALEGPYVDGERHGWWKIRTPAGDVAEGPFVRGLMHGRWLIHGSDGSETEGSYVDGKEHGVWTHLDPQGRESQQRFVHGCVAGPGGVAGTLDCPPPESTTAGEG